MVQHLQQQTGRAAEHKGALPFSFLLKLVAVMAMLASGVAFAVMQLLGI